MTQQQNLTVYAGTNNTLTLYARDESNNPQSLVSEVIVWRVGKPPRMPTERRAIISKTGTIVDAANGVFTVSLEPADTVGMGGNFVHMALTSFDGAIQFTDDSDNDLDFIDDDGNELIFVSDNDAFVSVVTQGTLTIRHSVQV